MGIFSGLDLADAPDSPFEAPVGTWQATITAVETFAGKKDPTAEYLKFEFTEKEGNGSFDHICQLPDIHSDDKTNRTRRSRIKQVLNSLEIDPETMDEMEESKIVGTPVIITTVKNVAKNGNTYVNLRSLKLDYGDENIPTATIGSGGAAEGTAATATGGANDPWDFSSL